MKLLFTGDWHLTDKSPKRRTDDYFNTQVEKVKYLMDFALNEANIDAIIQPGDFFDSHKTPDYVKQFYINLLKEYGIPIYTIPGQHDMRYHSTDIENTPMKVMHEAGVVNIISCGKQPDLNSNVFLYGAGFGEDIPECITPGAKNILVIHTMVIKSKEEKLWDKQEDFCEADALLKLNFDIVVSGDNHQSFTKQYEGRSLFNCGSLMRSTISQVDHQPVFYIFDTATGQYSQNLIPIEEYPTVFDMSTAEKEKEKNEKLEAFINGLSDETEIVGMDFQRNLKTYIADNKIDTRIVSIIDEVMEDAV